MARGALVHMTRSALLRWSHHFHKYFFFFNLKSASKSLIHWSACTKQPVLEEMLKHICFKFPNIVSTGIKNICASSL